jgi:S-adenosylmethionine-diacylgycerolhomoserine-N-methlytransferase
MATALGTPLPDIRARMARMYRPQKHIYDLTRRYYLLGRDRLIDGLDLQHGQSVLDIGCGTGRNLAFIGDRWPAAPLYGIDAAEPMLDVARARLRRDAVRATLAHGVAERLEPLTTFGCRGFDHVTISYCLSMVDDPEAAVRAATTALLPGGTLHIVDFGDMARLHRWFAGAMRAWLARFHVRHRPEVEATVRELAETRGAAVERIEIAGRYALLHRLRLPAA